MAREYRTRDRNYELPLKLRDQEQPGDKGVELYPSSERCLSPVRAICTREPRCEALGRLLFRVDHPHSGVKKRLYTERSERSLLGLFGVLRASPEELTPIRAEGMLNPIPLIEADKAILVSVLTALGALA